MLTFIKENWVTIIILLALAVLVFLAIRKIVKDKKAGIGPCGQECATCPRASACNKLEE